MFKMSQVKLFISHSERDERFAAPLADWLQAGLDLGRDDIRCTSVYPIQGGRPAPDVLKEDLRSAQVIIGLLSTNSLGSHWAQMEMGAGWVQDRLCPVRIPGIRHGDLPPPHDGLVSPGYCETQSMHDLMEDIAEVLNIEVQSTADQKLEQITRSAEEMLMADAVRWFSLPVVLSAWRIDPDTYSHAFHALCCEDQLNLSEDRLMDYVTADGVVSGRPDELPNWAQDHWTISMEAVNFMLSPSSANPHLLKVPKNVLPGEMIAEMKNALGSGKDRSRRMQQWFENATEYLSENSPIARHSHGGSGHL
jgi:hypothetical protein